MADRFPTLFPAPLNFLVLEGHEVFTAAYAGLSGISNGQLLTQAALKRFDALITCDTGMPDQHNPADLPVAIVVLHAKSNDLTDLLPLIPALLKTLGHLTPKSTAHVG